MPLKPRSTAIRVLSALTLLALAGCLSEPSQTYRSNLQRTETGDDSNTTLTNLAELGVQDRVGPGFEYRLGERFIYSETEAKREGTEDFDSTDLLNQPSVDLRMTFGTLAWEQGYELQQNRSTIDGGPDNDRTRTDILQRLEWTPEEGLPQVNAWLDYRTVEDDFTFDQETLETAFEIEQQLGTVDYEYSYRDEDLEDHAGNADNDREEHDLRVSHNDEYMEGKLSSSLSLFAEERRNTTRFPSGGGGTVPANSIAGLSIVDTTPQIAVLQTNNALDDTDTTVTAGINIGGAGTGGELNWNMGLRLVADESVDEIHLYTVDPVDSLIENDFSFSIWASDDNSFWSLVTSSASYEYEQPLRRFRITIPSVTTRYIKVVNTAVPAAAPAVLVTEMDVFRRVSGTGSDSNKRTDSIRNATGNLTWRLSDTFSLAWDVFAQTFESDDDGDKTRDQFRLDNGLTALWSPTDIVDVSLRGEARTEDDDVQEDEDFAFANGLVSVQPLDTLDFALNYSYSDRNVDGDDDLETNAAQISTSAQLLDTLQIDLSAEVSSQDDARNSREIDRTILSASVFAELTPKLDLTLGLRNEEGDVSGSGADTIPDPSEDRYELVVLYRPSDRFTMEAQLEHVDSFAGSGLDQRYQLDWFPFRDGSLDIQLDYDRTDTESSGQRAVDRYRILTRWTVNPKAFFEFVYGREDPDDGAATDVIRVSFNFSG